MATIHTGTTLTPGKLELLTGWLPRQPWYRGSAPELSRAGGFRLDDPAGEVGIELMVVTDAAGGGETAYFVPMTYRAEALAGADEGLIGTSEHGVLGPRWVYDAAHDPVAVTQLLEFICGRVEAQHQSRSDTADPTVGRSWTAEGRPTASAPLRVSDDDGRTTIAVDGDRPLSLDLVRVLPGPGTAALGSVEAGWTLPDGGPARGTVAVVR